MKRILKRMFALGLAAMMGLSMAACSGGGSGSSTDTKAVDKLEQVKEKGVLTLGCSADFPPYEFWDITSGTPVIAGFDISLANEICADMGVELKIEEMAFDGLLAAMEAGNIDIIISGMNATEERKKAVLFSDEYYFPEQCVLVRATDVGTYNSIADFAGKRVGAQTGSVQEGIVDDQFTESEKLAIANVANLVLELQSQRIDGLVLDLPIAEAFARQHDDVVISSCAVEGDDSGFAVAMPLGSDTLAGSINETLKRLKDENKIDQLFSDAVELSGKQEAAE